MTNENTNTAMPTVDNAAFEKFVSDFLKNTELSQKAANKAIHAAARDALFSKSADRANILWNAAKGTVHAKTIKRGLLDFTGGFFTDTFGTFRAPELAAIQWNAKGQTWEVTATGEELAAAVAKYRTVERVAYTAMKFDATKGEGLTLAAVKAQVEKWIAKPDKWNSAGAAELADTMAELLPLLGMEVPLNIANRQTKRAA